MIRDYQPFTSCSVGLQLDAKNVLSTKWSVRKAIWMSEKFPEYIMTWYRNSFKFNSFKMIQLPIQPLKKINCARSWNPKPLIKGGKGLGPSKNWVIWGRGGVPKILLERGDNSEQEGVDVEMGGGGLSLFYYFTVQSHLLCVWGKSKVCFITFWLFILQPYKILIQVFIVLKHCIIFLIHSDSVQ